MADSQQTASAQPASAMYGDARQTDAGPRERPVLRRVPTHGAVENPGDPYCACC